MNAVTRTHLPREEGDHAEVDGHVRDPSRVVPLLHLRHQRRRHRPRHHHRGPGVQVGPREELLRPEVRVDGPLDGGERPEPEQQRAGVVVTVAYLQGGRVGWGGGGVLM